MALARARLRADLHLTISPIRRASSRWAMVGAHAAFCSTTNTVTPPRLISWTFVLDGARVRAAMQPGCSGQAAGWFDTTSVGL
jgi:hypothetical protein